MDPEYQRLGAPPSTSTVGLGWPSYRSSLLHGFPRVAGGCLVLFLFGFPMWLAGMQQARVATRAVLDDMGVGATSIHIVERNSVIAVSVLLPVSILLVAAAAYLVRYRYTFVEAGKQRAFNFAWYLRATQVVTALNWLLLLALAFALSGLVTWLSDAYAANQAAQSGSGGGSTPPWGPYPPHAAASPAGISSNSAEWQQQLQQQQQQQQQQQRLRDQAAPYPSSGSICPPGCVDFSSIAKFIGMPWPCLCIPDILDDLKHHTGEVIHSTTVGVVGVVLMFAAVSWLMLLLVADYTDALRDEAERLQADRVQLAASEQAFQGATTSLT